MRQLSKALVSDSEDESHQPPINKTKIAPKVESKAIWNQYVDPDTDNRLLSTKFRNTHNLDEARKVRNTYKRGKFSPMEKEAVDDAIQTCLKQMGIPPADLELLIHRKTKALTHGRPNPYSDKKYEGFISRILQQSGLNRSLDQLYDHISRRYSSLRTGGKAWTKEEDEQLKLLVAQKGTRWREIEIQMEKTDVKSRYKKIMIAESSNGKKGVWIAEERERFQQGMRAIMDREGLTDPIHFNHWAELAALVGSRSDTQCRNYW